MTLLVEAYKGTRRKHNMKFKQIGHTTSQYGQSFFPIINGLAQVPFEDVLVEAYKDTRRKHNFKFRQIGHTTSQYGQSFFS